jgi:2-hydroxychromene-2-carboxylate isomerase
MKTIDWYFDVISPFAYLQSERLDKLAARAQLRLKPVLFAGLLNHFGNIGPAEIAPKRRFTFERVAWLAHRESIALTMPAMHPFNPLPLLRFVIAAGNTVDAMHAAFRFVWQEGRVPQDETALTQLLTRFDLVPAQLQSEEVKQVLHRNGQGAIAAGVFGVPTSVVGERVFWGQDSTDMLLAYLAGDAFFDSALMRMAQHLPDGVQRRKPAAS